MKLRNANFSSLLITGAVVLMMSAGCGLHRTGPIEDPPDSPAPTTAPSTAPATGSVTPSPSPTPPNVPVITGDLSARVQSVKTTGLMFTRKVIAVVEVTNPVSVPLSGQVTCTFGTSNPGGTQDVSLAANETRTYTFEEKSWFDKTAKVDVKTTHATSTAAFRQY